MNQAAAFFLGSDGRRERLVNLLLIGILVIGAVLRFMNLGGPDVLADDAHYSLRSIGYIDFVAATNRQGTPVSWFDEPVWWQGLSFHDAPPLVFAVSHFFFLVFGDSLFAARLPFVLVGVISIYAIFLLGRKMFDPWVGILAALILSISNFSVWISRIGLLDGFVLLFVILSVFFFLKARDDPRYYLIWGGSLAGGLLSKYTFLFLLPVFAAALVFFRRTVWRDKRFFAGVVVFLILISPVIVYNAEMWLVRGHPDAAISTMLGMEPEDWSGLTRSVHSVFSVGAVVSTVVSRISPGLSLLLFFALIFFAYQTVRRKEYDEKNFLLWPSLFSGLIMLTLAGGSDRYDVILLPFLFLIGAFAMYRILSSISGGRRFLLTVAIVLIGSGELFFTVQNELLAEPVIASRIFIDQWRPRWLGFNALDNYVEEFYEKFPAPSDIVIFAKVPQLAEYQENRIRRELSKYGGKRQEHLLVFDDRMDWSPALWTFERRKLYDNRPIHSLTQFIDKVREGGVSNYTKFGLKDVTFIIASKKLETNEAVDKKLLKSFEDQLIAEVKPIDQITAPDGSVVFTVYRVPLN